MDTRKNKRFRQETRHPSRPPKPVLARLGPVLLAFAFGAVLTGGGFLIFANADEVSRNRDGPSRGTSDAGHRTVAQLMALSDADLEKVDVLELNIVVAREIPGLEKLDYDNYRQTVDDWTDRFARWLPTVEYAFHQNPDKYKNDINFFRLGMLAQFLDEMVGVRYVPEQKQAQVQGRKEGQHVSVLYKNAGDLLVHGLIDTKQGTCGNMPTLHVIIGRRMGWPVSLACAKSHYVCRYEDGKVCYNIEATDTGRGGFAEGSDLRKLTAREMLGTFVSLRARHFADTDQWALADRDYALSRVLFPTHRQAYKESLDAYLIRGIALFEPSEQGHPNSLLAYLSGVQRPGAVASARPDFDPIEEAQRVNAINRANMEQMMPPLQPAQTYQVPTPGVPQPPSSNGPRPGVPQPYHPPGMPEQPRKPRLGDGL